MLPGALTHTLRIDPPGTRTLWADRAGPWLVALARYPSGNGLRWHSHDHASFHLTVRGSSRERYWRVDRGKLAGTAQYYARGVGHETTFGPDGAVVLHAVRASGDDPRAGVLAEPDPRPMLALLRAVYAGDASSLLDAEAACDELEASVAAGTGLGESSTPAWLLDIRERLFDDPGELPSLAELALDAGVHPAHLARTFRARFGRTIGDFARLRRLQIAADALVTTGVPIASIALDAGFCDQSHFGRAFVGRYGTTPARFRSEIRSGAGPQTRV